MKEKFTTKIIVTSTRVTSSGRTRSGGDYHLWQVIATKPSGEPITLNLRAFEELPTNEVIEVDAELFRSENYGDSYTLKRKGGGGGGSQGGGGAVEQAVSDLRARVKRIEDFLTGRGEFRGTAAEPDPPQAAPPPAPPPSTPPPAPPPAAPPVQPDPPTGGLASDNDIPF